MYKNRLREVLAKYNNGRTRGRLTQVDLARICNVHPMSVYYWMKNRKRPTSAHANALCEALGCQKTDLFYIEN